MEIGFKIKERRLVLGLTLEELGNRCDLTKGYLSQLENDLTSPSIETLKDILLALGTNLKQFFSEDDEEKVVFDEKDYIEKDTGESKVVWLVPSSQKNEMEPICITLQPGKDSGTDMPHEGEEFGFVLSGTIRLYYGKHVYKLSKGDSFYFKADKMHYISCSSKIEARVLWISSPPNF